jgi:hypothetical protein
MKALLIKQVDNYTLWNYDGGCIATTNESTYQKLSKVNCDKLYISNIVYLAERESKYSEEDYIEGFIKSTELNKDKLFTFEDMYDAVMLGVAYEDCGIQGVNSYNELKDLAIKRASRSKGIEVNIEMECPQCQDYGYISECRNNCNQKFLQPKLDNNGCLILNKL